MNKKELITKHFNVRFKMGMIMTIYMLVCFGCTQIGIQEGMSQQNVDSLIEFDENNKGFELANGGSVASLLIDKSADSGIQKVLKLFQNDVHLVTGMTPALSTNINNESDNIIIVGEVDKSEFLNSLEKEGKIKLDGIRGKWENSLIQNVDNPFPGVNSALVVAGSDKRGVIYGLMELSEQMGVSPWYYWADVPVTNHQTIYVKEGIHNLGEPKVKYRGIFINDEEPALGSWVRENFGGFNVKFYEKVFELILRMKGNYLWPAMWGKAFADDDPANAVLANELGIVIGYSHHEPMMRAHKEWEKYGEGDWNYNTNKENLQDFWRKGIERNKGLESIITVGMRGDGDEPMSEERNIDLLQQIVNDQRGIIEEVTNKKASELPQTWALYKEVQEYYDNGMRVDDDIILLYCDDNWGNVRRLPGEKERSRKGGSGMYYHFDYVGGPRSYKWINTSHLPKVWEQNKLAYEYGIDKLWVVNVGDIKPMELPTQFYLDLAWNPDAIGTKDLDEYTQRWAKQQFGAEYSMQIGFILSKYGKIASRRKPEQLDMNSFSLRNYREYEQLVNELNQLNTLVNQVEEKLNSKYLDAYFQLVRYPVEALANLYNMYNAQAKNYNYYKQDRMITNLMADSVEYYFKKDSLLKNHYHYQISQGKWNHIMDQSKIGYTSWNSPPKDIHPRVKRIDVKEISQPGIYVEGQLFEGNINQLALPCYDAFNKQQFYFELFNKGCRPFEYSIQTNEDWIKLTSQAGDILDQKRIFVSIDWEKIPVGSLNGLIEVNAEGLKYEIEVKAHNPSDKELKNINGFIESNGFITFEASDYSKKTESNGYEWKVIPDIGLTGDGITVSPRLTQYQSIDSTTLEYNINVKEAGQIKVYAYFSPTLNYTEGDGFEYAVSVNDEKPVVVNVHKNKKHSKWSRMVTYNCNVCVSEHTITQSGNNILRYHMLSPGLVLQKIVIDTGGLKMSSLGPIIYGGKKYRYDQNKN